MQKIVDKINDMHVELFKNLNENKYGKNCISILTSISN